MIYLQASLLFTATLLSGASFFFLPKKVARHGELFLTFGGSFLFSLTLVEILPSFYSLATQDTWLVYYLLAGFFFQFFLDLLSQGIAHGHLHEAHTHRPISAFGLLVALCIHALFDGLLVSGATHLMEATAGHAHHEHAHHGHAHHGHGLLSGVLLHKIPATLSLVAILVQHQYSVRTIACYVLLFALASPLGCFASTFVQNNDPLTSKAFMAFWALAVGNLLHIATTTLAEANTEHRFRPAILMANLAGAALAVISVLY